MPNRIGTNSHFSFTHVDIFHGDEILKDQYLEIKDNDIVAIKATHTMQEITIKHDNAQGLLVTAGFIDLQLNGYGSVLLNGDTHQHTKLNGICRIKSRRGTKNGHLIPCESD